MMSHYNSHSKVVAAYPKGQQRPVSSLAHTTAASTPGQVPKPARSYRESQENVSLNLLIKASGFKRRENSTVGLKPSCKSIDPETDILGESQPESVIKNWLAVYRRRNSSQTNRFHAFWKQKRQCLRRGKRS